MTRNLKRADRRFLEKVPLKKIEIIWVREVSSSNIEKDGTVTNSNWHWIKMAEIKILR